MNSVFLRPTGKFDDQGRELREPQFLNNRVTAAKLGSLYIGGDPANGVDVRLNAASTTAQEATGYQILTDTMTYIKQTTTQQSFYELAGKKPSDFVPIAVGDGSWSADILTRREFSNSGDFESGLVRQASNSARNTESNVSMDSVSIPTFIWTDGVNYNLAEIEQAMLASNWDVIAGKHRSRVKKWQLGIQKIAFLGSRNGQLEGLLNNTKVNVNTAFITQAISASNTAQFVTFVAGLIAAYFANTNSTKLPNRFVIPMADFLALQVPVPGTVTLRTMISYLTEAFQAVCGPEFKIEGCAYCDAANANSFGAPNKNTYALYRYDAEAFRMDIPVGFTVTQPNSVNNFHFQDLAYGQLTGCGFYRPLEVYLFQY